MNSFASTPDRSFGPDPFPGDPWSWTRVVFRWIDEFPGYCVGSDGSIFRYLDVPGRNGLRWRPITPGTTHHGHRNVRLQCDGRDHYRYVHRLVLEAFIGPCPEGMETRHRDGDPGNNSVANLRWGTHRENMADRTQHGRNPTQQGELHPRAILCEADIPVIRQLHAAGLGCTEIGRRFGVSYTTIYSIIKGINWSHVQ